MCKTLNLIRCHVDVLLSLHQRNKICFKNPFSRNSVVTSMDIVPIELVKVVSLRNVGKKVTGKKVTEKSHRFG